MMLAKTAAYGIIPLVGHFIPNDFQVFQRVPNSGSACFEIAFTHRLYPRPAERRSPTLLDLRLPPRRRSGRLTQRCPTTNRELPPDRCRGRADCPRGEIDTRRVAGEADGGCR